MSERKKLARAHKAPNDTIGAHLLLLLSSLQQKHSYFWLRKVIFLKIFSASIWPACGSGWLGWPCSDSLSILNWKQDVVLNGECNWSKFGFFCEMHTSQCLYIFLDTFPHFDLSHLNYHLSLFVLPAMYFLDGLIVQLNRSQMCPL